jgi:hypothetical protein
MPKPVLTRKRILLAYVVAGIADVLEFPITAVENTGLGFIPGAVADGVVDVTVMGILTWLLGFHWLFLPSFLLEAVPELDLLPTWVGCVAYVVWRRKPPGVTTSLLPSSVSPSAPAEATARRPDGASKP